MTTANRRRGRGSGTGADDDAPSGSQPDTSADEQVTELRGERKILPFPNKEAEEPEQDDTGLDGYVPL